MLLTENNFAYACRILNFLKALVIQSKLVEIQSTSFCKFTLAIHCWRKVIILTVGWISLLLNVQHDLLTNEWAILTSVWLLHLDCTSNAWSNAAVYKSETVQEEHFHRFVIPFSFFCHWLLLKYFFSLWPFKQGRNKQEVLFCGGGGLQHSTNDQGRRFHRVIKFDAVALDEWLWKLITLPLSLQLFVPL